MENLIVLKLYPHTPKKRANIKSLKFSLVQESYSITEPYMTFSL